MWFHKTWGAELFRTAMLNISYATYLANKPTCLLLVVREIKQTLFWSNFLPVKDSNKHYLSHTWYFSRRTRDICVYLCYQLETTVPMTTNPIRNEPLVRRLLYV